MKQKEETDFQREGDLKLALLQGLSGAAIRQVDLPHLPTRVLKVHIESP